MIEWSHWHNEPYLVGGLVLVGWLYAILAGPFRSRLTPDEPYPTRRAIKFYASLIIFYLAVGSPLDQIAERFLFSAHMAQHFLLMFPVPILFLLGLPHWMVDRALGWNGLRNIGRFITHPLICGVIFVLVTSVWHAPILYEWALHDKFVHIVEHLMFFGASLLYWWTQLSPSKVFPRKSYAMQMLFQLAVVIALTPVFAYITFSTEILYPTYEFAPRIIASLDPGNDQLLAGVIMKLGGMLVVVGAVAVSFYRWHQSTESLDQD
ncbi:MAG: hypothetical protein CMI16_03780 [Opitutaceae bacterium]|nr:hypothetical protein [Opitutaceae bacterium]|tara:strand:+ start:3613 stop:4404 length:792 start_codon:yes stop_codon:yes gene_type:complete